MIEREINKKRERESEQKLVKKKRKVGKIERQGIKSEK